MSHYCDYRHYYGHRYCEGHRLLCCYMNWCYALAHCMYGVAGEEVVCEQMLSEQMAMTQEDLDQLVWWVED